MEKVKILWSGITGRTGREAIELAKNSDTVEITAGLSRSNTNYYNYDELDKIKEDFDVIVDFSHKDSFDKVLDFALKVADQLKKQTKSCIDGYKQVGGIFVSLATLFVSCPLLNWVYPRFMAAVFPNLSNGKHKKDTSNLIEQANNTNKTNPTADNSSKTQNSDTKKKVEVK